MYPALYCMDDHLKTLEAKIPSAVADFRARVAAISQKLNAPQQQQQQQPAPAAGNNQKPGAAGAAIPAQMLAAAKDDLYWNVLYAPLQEYFDVAFEKRMYVASKHFVSS